MNNFKKNLMLLLFVIILGLLIYFILSSLILSFAQAKLQTTFKSTEDNYTCQGSIENNLNSIALEYDLELFSGETVISQVEKGFSHPLVPKGYKISSDDLEEAYALAKDDVPQVLYLTLKDEEKFEKVSKFLFYGQFFVGYSESSNEHTGEIFIGANHEILDEFMEMFSAQDC